MVEVSIGSPPHHGSDDLDDEHFREELDLRAEQMATVSAGVVLLESDRDVDVWLYLVVFRVIGDGSTAERFNVCQVHLAPYRGIRVLQLVTGADKIDFAESGDKGRNVGLPDIDAFAECSQRGVEIFTVVEGHAEGPSQG